LQFEIILLFITKIHLLQNSVQTLLEKHKPGKKYLILQKSFQSKRKTSDSNNVYINVFLNLSKKHSLGAEEELCLNYQKGHIFCTRYCLLTKCFKEHLIAIHALSIWCLAKCGFQKCDKCVECMLTLDTMTFSNIQQALCRFTLKLPEARLLYWNEICKSVIVKRH